MRVVCIVLSCELISDMNYDRMQHEGHQSMLAIILLQYRRPPPPLFALFKDLISKNQLLIDIFWKTPANGRGHYARTS